VSEREKHTPVPWGISKLSLESGLYQSDGAVAILADGERIALVDCQTKFKRGEGHKAKCPIRDANARLIAAAPGLLEACKELLGIVQLKCGNLHADTNAIQDRARAAIANATKGGRDGNDRLTRRN
jgi:hypothetical protein